MTVARFVKSGWKKLTLPLRRRFYGRKMKRSAVRALLAITTLDSYQHRIGWPRWRRQQWWRDFIKSPAFRDEQVKNLVKEMSER